eukprot:scaffold291442_cov22-Tisochrysis_lutea.AAC.3
MLREMAEVKAAVEQREKRERKKLREAKRKARVRWVLIKADLSGSKRCGRLFQECRMWVTGAEELSSRRTSRVAVSKILEEPGWSSMRCD